MTWTRQHTASLLFLISFYAVVVLAIPSPQNDQPDKIQDDWYDDLDGDWDDMTNEGEVILNRSKRRGDLTDIENDDTYTIIENTTVCDWCGNDIPEDDDEFKKATIYNQGTTYIEPGTCVVNKSPGYPARYPNDVDYRWRYKTHPKSVLTFTIPAGGLQISKRCFRDKLLIRVGNRVVKKCAQFYNFQIDSGNTAQMYIRFASNHRIRWHGYKGTICAAGLPPTTTTESPSTTTPESTTTTTPPEPIQCDDICGDANGFTGRISMGSDSPITYPWVIIIDIMRTEVFVRCSGYLISKKHIITSAFCFFQETPMGVDDVMVRVIAGEYDITSSETPTAQVMYSDNVTLYDLFDADNGGGVYNIAIITMPGEGFTLNTRVSPICLANDTIHSDLATPNTNLMLSGFGWTENDYPVLNMTTVTLKTCFFTFPDVDLICIYIPTSISTPCHGDAGACIYKQWTDGRYYSLAHINAVTVDSCPLNGHVFPCPATSYYRDWIDSVTGPRYCNN